MYCRLCPLSGITCAQVMLCRSQGRKVGEKGKFSRISPFAPPVGGDGDRRPCRCGSVRSSDEVPEPPSGATRRGKRAGETRVTSQGFFGLAHTSGGSECLLI